MAYDLSKLPMSKLVNLYNQITDSPLKKFRDKITAVKRVSAAVANSAFTVVDIDGEAQLLADDGTIDENEDVVRKPTGRKSPLLGKKIELVTLENPKRKGSRTRERYDIYSSVATSDAFMATCLDKDLGSRREILSDLAYDSRMGFINLI